MKNSITNNQDAWAEFFKVKDIVTTIGKNGHVYISAAELKKVTGREPRLLAKMDTLESRPEIFQKNNLVIFPVKNGEYVVFRDPEQKSYFKFNKDVFQIAPEEYDSEIALPDFDTFSKTREFSESQAIDYAFIASLIRSFVCDKNLQLTLRGRLRSGEFNLIPSQGFNISVKGVQIEVDSGYESDLRIVLIEAKIGRRDNFHIRQLYYPYLEWASRTRKEVIPIFMVFSNGLYYLTQFRFNNSFGDLTVIKNKCFIINEAARVKISFDELKSIQLEHEPKLPFPQADDMDKIVDIVSFMNDGAMDKKEIADFFEFDERQSDYYANAAAYLNFLERDGREGFAITAEGKSFAKLKSRYERTKFLINRFMKIPSLHSVLILFQDKNFDLSKIQKNEIAVLIQKHRSDICSSTSQRRAQTILGWLKWISENVEFRQ